MQNSLSNERIAEIAANYFHQDDTELADIKAAIRAALYEAEELAEQSRPTPEQAGTDETPSFTNPLTPYGMLVRALRIVAGTLLYDMARHMGVSPATLSAMEFDRKPVTYEMAVAASGYFHGLGIHGTLPAIEAARAAMDRSALGREA